MEQLREQKEQSEVMSKHTHWVEKTKATGEVLMWTMAAYYLARYISPGSQGHEATDLAHGIVAGGVGYAVKMYDGIKSVLAYMETGK